MSIKLATVTITMGGRDYVLTPSYDVQRALGRLMGGFLPLFRAVGNVDGETMALIVAAGTGKKGKAVEDIARAVYDHGLDEMVDPLNRFLTLCINGGRDPNVRPAPKADGESAAPGPEAPNSDVPESLAAA